MKTAVVILNWNGRNFLEKFLPIVVEYSPTAEIIVGDNASTDTSIDFLSANFPQIKIIQNDKNYGFAGGYNRVLEQVDAEYLVLLNSDIEVTPHWIDPIVEMLEKNPKIGAVQPKLLSYYERNQFEYAGAAGGYIDFLGYPFCRGRIFDTVEADKGQYNDEKQIFWATGAAFFIKKDVFFKVGGFDEDFFAHQEEIDLCWRLQSAGYQNFYCPTSVVYHVGGGTLPKASPFKNFLNFRNNLFLLYKNLPNKKFIPIFLLRIFLDCIASLKILFSDGMKASWAVARGYFDFFKKMKIIRPKRNKSNIKINTIYSKSILWEYYVKKNKHWKH
ncbi:MAG: glycosyltransferase family 2 protein [Bacteroidales bacterium]|jgi:GT2 family glycosyltransferase|nr:glycosyltransferase family 2 protein [Bacteroidales bacterium]